MSFSSNEDVSR